MKQFLCLTCCLLLSLLCITSTKAQLRPLSSQSPTSIANALNISDIKSPGFEFQKDGSFSSGDGKPFVVYEAPGKSQRDLYQSMMIGIAKLFNHPDKVISSVEPSLITVNSITSPCIPYGNQGKLKEVTYSMQIQFKDGKIRIDAPNILKYPKYDGWGDAIEWIKFQNLYPKAKIGLEAEFNNLISTMLQNSFGPASEW